MQVFVTGGTGAVGKYAVAALVSAGHDVRAMARSDAGAEWLKHAGARPVAASLFDVEALTDGFAGCEAVINLATALPKTKDFHRISAWKDNFRVRTEGSAAVLDAALAAGVPRLVQESVAMIYRDGGESWIDETGEVDDYPMAQSNLAAEKSAQRFSHAGGAGVILRFGWFYGPGAAHSEEFLSIARRFGVCVALGAADTYVSSIHVADAGRAAEAALRAPPGVYNVVDDRPLTKRDYAAAIAAAAGRKLYLRAPGGLAKIMGEGTTALTRSLRASNGKFRRACGWAPVFESAREGWIAMAGQAPR